jgi:hypothetical protein
MADRVAELALQHHAAVVEQRNHHHRARVHDVLARGGVAVGQADRVALGLQEIALDELLAADEFFTQMRIGDR